MRFPRLENAVGTGLTVITGRERFAWHTLSHWLAGALFSIVKMGKTKGQRLRKDIVNILPDRFFMEYDILMHVQSQKLLL